MQNTFNSGYTQALLHMQNIFYKMIDQGITLNKKAVLTYMDLAIKNRSELRDTGFIENVKYNKKDGFFKDE